MHKGFSSGSAAEIVPYSIVVIRMKARYTESTDKVRLVHTDPDFITYFTSLSRRYIPYIYITAITQHGTMDMIRQTGAVIAGMSANEETIIHRAEKISIDTAVQTTADASPPGANRDIDNTDMDISPIIMQQGKSESILLLLTA